MRRQFQEQTEGILKRQRGLGLGTQAFWRLCEVHEHS